MNAYGLFAVLDRQARRIGSANCITGAGVVARAAAGYLKARVADVSKKRRGEAARESHRAQRRPFPASPRRSSLNAAQAQELHGGSGQQVTDAAVEDELQRREAPRAAFAAHHGDGRKALQRDEEEDD